MQHIFLPKVGLKLSVVLSAILYLYIYVAPNRAIAQGISSKNYTCFADYTACTDVNGNSSIAQVLALVDLNRIDSAIAVLAHTEVTATNLPDFESSLRRWPATLSPLQKAMVSLLSAKALIYTNELKADSLCFDAYVYFDQADDADGLLQSQFVMLSIIDYSFLLHDELNAKEILAEALELSIQSRCPYSRLLIWLRHISLAAQGDYNIDVLPETIQTYNMQAQSWFQAGDISVNQYRSFLNAMAAWYYSQGNRSQALAFYQQEQTLLDSADISFTPNLGNIGVCLFDLGQYQDAINYLSAAVSDKLNGSMHQSHYALFRKGLSAFYLGAAYRQMGQIDSCYKYLIMGATLHQDASILKNKKERAFADKRFDLHRKQSLINDLDRQIKEENYRKQLWIAISLLMLVVVLLIAFLLRFKSRAAQNAQRLSAHREKLLQVISHDLFGAINQMVGFTKIYNYARAELSMAEFEALEKKFVSSAVSIEITMRNILSWGQFGKNDNLNVSSIELCTLIDQIIDTYHALVEEKGITLEVHCPRASFRSDPFHLSAMVRNLIYNAIKHGVPNTTVHISAEVVEAQLHFFVENQTTRANIAAIEHLVTQINRRQVAESQGLGLEIIARSLQLLHGRLQFTAATNRARLSVALPTMA